MISHHDSRLPSEECLSYLFVFEWHTRVEYDRTVVRSRHGTERSLMTDGDGIDDLQEGRRTLSWRTYKHA